MTSRASNAGIMRNSQHPPVIVTNGYRRQAGSRLRIALEGSAPNAPEGRRSLPLLFQAGHRSKGKRYLTQDAQILMVGQPCLPKNSKPVPVHHRAAQQQQGGLPICLSAV